MVKQNDFNELVKFREIEESFISDFSHFEKKINVDYGTTFDYAENWGVIEVIRELISNALDTNSFESVSIDETKKVVLIEDSGCGISLRNLLMGNSEKESDNAIGKFGEGLKLSCLVMQRNNLKIQIESNGFLIKPESYRIEEIDNIECFRMVAYKKQEETEGTSILLEYNSIQEVFLGLDLFLCLKREKKELYQNEFGEILESISSQKAIYVRGVKVQELNSLFSYNLYSNSLNRDRNMISEGELKFQILKVLDNIKLEEERGLLIRFILIKNLSNPDFYESSLFLFIPSAKFVFEEVYGKKAILCNEPHLFEDILYHKAKPIFNKTNWRLGEVLTDSKFLAEFDKKLEGLKIYKYSTSKISLQERKNLGIATRLAHKIFYPEWELKEIKAKVLLFIETKETSQISGFRNKGLIYINLKVLRELYETIDAIFHEFTHLKTGLGDGSDFASVLGKYMAKAIVYLQEKYVFRGK